MNDIDAASLTAKVSVLEGALTEANDRVTALEMQLALLADALAETNDAPHTIDRHRENCRLLAQVRKRRWETSNPHPPPAPASARGRLALGREEQPPEERQGRSDYEQNDVCGKVEIRARLGPG